MRKPLWNYIHSSVDFGSIKMKLRLGALRASSRLRKGGHLQSSSSLLPGPVLQVNFPVSSQPSANFPTSLVHSVPKSRPKASHITASPNPLPKERINRWTAKRHDSVGSPQTTRRTDNSYISSTRLKRNQSYVSEINEPSKGEERSFRHRRSVSRAAAVENCRPRRPNPSPHPIRPLFYRSPPGRNSIYYVAPAVPAKPTLPDIHVVSKKLL